MMISYQIPKALTVISVRAFLKQKGVSGSLFRTIKHHGNLRINGQPAHAVRTLLHGGDLLEYDLPPVEQEIEPEDLPLDIRYEDEDLLILNKAAGMLVHPTPKHRTGTVANALLGYYRSRGLSTAFHCVHRLDRLTSGLLLIAKRPEIQHLLTTKEGKTFRREYLAIAEGEMDPAEGTIDLPIARNPESIITRIVAPEGKPSVTHYRTLGVFDCGGRRCSLLRLVLETGRTHQIRVHLSHLGHPLLGDDLYGGSRDLMDRQALHAEHLQFSHPITGKPIDLRAELPEDMGRLLPQDLLLLS